MNLGQALAVVIRTTRKARGLTQEDFGVVSSRTYLSSLERALKSPTIEKLEELSSVLKVHPATLLVLATVVMSEDSGENSTLDRIISETTSLLDVVRTK